MHFAGLVLTIQWIWKQIVRGYHQLMSNLDYPRMNYTLVGVSHICHEFATALGPDEVEGDKHGNKGCLYKFGHFDVSMLDTSGCSILSQIKKKESVIYVIYQEDQFSLQQSQLVELFQCTKDDALKVIAVVIIRGPDPNNKSHPVRMDYDENVQERLEKRARQLKESGEIPADVGYRFFSVERNSMRQYEEVLTWVRLEL